MADKTKIQWCDSTVNPIMGCAGCELFQAPNQILRAVDDELISTGSYWQRGQSLSLAQQILNEGWSVLQATKVNTKDSGHVNEITTTNHLRWTKGVC